MPRRARSPSSRPGRIVVVTKSTVPVGTGDEVERIMREARPDGDFAVVSNPEFLREGAAIADFKRPDRIVIGTEDDRARDVMAELYRPLYLNQPPLLFTARRTSELIKYAANAFLAIKITFINEIADLCESVGADVQEVARGIGLDNRIGAKFLHAGPGYGGSCFPKDTLALVKTGAGLRARRCASSRRWWRSTTSASAPWAARSSRPAAAACAARRIARARPHLQAQHRRHARRAVAGHHHRRCRMPARACVAYDPEGMDQARAMLTDVDLRAGSLRLRGGRGRARHRHRVGRVPRARSRPGQGLLKSPVVVDLRNIYRPEDMRKRGFQYVGVGRG